MWSARSEWGGRDQWVGEFAAWRSEHRTGARIIPDDFPIAEGSDQPLTEDELYRELLSSWFTAEFPEFAYCCSPHRIALLRGHLPDFYDEDFAQLLVRLVPDLAAWLAERAGLPADLARHSATHAVDTEHPTVDPVYGDLDPLARVQE